jgi:acetamidase/formamidase
MSWLKDSIMHRRGVAHGDFGETHELTEARQGKFHFTMGPYSTPVLHIRPGDRVVVETRDAFGGAIKTERDLPTQKLTMPFVNPQNGPIMVEGAEKGDVVAVYIESMAPRGPNPRGTCCMIPEFGALTGTAYLAGGRFDQPTLPPYNHGGNIRSTRYLGPGSITYLPFAARRPRVHRRRARLRGDGESAAWRSVSEALPSTSI